MAIDEEAKERQAAKRGRHKVEERERVKADAAAATSSAPAPLLPGLVAQGVQLPDDGVDMDAKAAGRPVGARAAAPGQYRRYILSTKGDFIGRLAGIANVDTIQLARVLGCKPLEALRIQRDLAATAAPYVYTAQPRPPEEVAAAYWAGMVFAAGAEAKAGAAPKMSALAALAGRPPDIEEIQALGPVDFAVSEDAASEDDEKAP